MEEGPGKSLRQVFWLAAIATSNPWVWSNRLRKLGLTIESSPLDIAYAVSGWLWDEADQKSMDLLSGGTVGEAPQETRFDAFWQWIEEQANPPESLVQRNRNRQKRIESGASVTVMGVGLGVTTDDA